MPYITIAGFSCAHTTTKTTPDQRQDAQRCSTFLLFICRVTFVRHFVSLHTMKTRATRRARHAILSLGFHISKCDRRICKCLMFVVQRDTCVCQATAHCQAHLGTFANLNDEGARRASTHIQPLSRNEWNKRDSNCDPKWWNLPTMKDSIESRTRWVSVIKTTSAFLCARRERNLEGKISGTTDSRRDSNTATCEHSRSNGCEWVLLRYDFSL